MPPNVRIDSRAYLDPRFRLLGKLLGTSEFDALGRVSYLWLHCTERCTYVLSETLVGSVVDVEALILSELGDRVDGGVRLRGTEGRVEWFARMQQSGRNSAQKRWNPNGSPIGDRMGIPKEEEEEDLSLSSEASPAEKSKPRAKPDEPTAEEWPVVERVLGKLSEAAGVAYEPKRNGKPTNSVKFILRRLRENCSEDELRMVIRHRYLEWGHKDDMREHLTAETVFGRAKFDTYLAKAKAAVDGPPARAGPDSSTPVSPVVQDFLRGVR